MHQTKLSVTKETGTFHLRKEPFSFILLSFGSAFCFFPLLFRELGEHESLLLSAFEGKEGLCILWWERGDF